MSSQETGPTEIVAPKPTYRWLILVSSWSLYFVFGLIHTAISVLVTPVMNSLNLTYSQMGVILGSWQFVYIFFAQPAGLLVDHIGPYKSLFIGVTVISLSAALRLFAMSFETLLVFVALFGIGGPMISIGLPKLISTWFVGEERGTASGVYATGPSIGGIVALSLTENVVLPMVGDWKNVFLVYGSIGFLIALSWLFVERRAPSPRVAKVSTPPGKEQVWGVMRQLFKSKNIWLVVLIGIASFLASHGLLSWLPEILEAKGVAAQEVRILASLSYLFGMIGSVLAPQLLHVVRSKKRAITINLFTLGIATLVFGLTNGPPMVIAMAVAAIMMRGLLPLLMVTLMDMPEVGPKRMGVVGGLYFSIGEIGGFGGPFVMGLLKDVTGSYLSGIIFIVVVTELSIVFAALLESDKPKHTTS